QQQLGVARSVSDTQAQARGGSEIPYADMALLPIQPKAALAADRGHRALRSGTVHLAPTREDRALQRGAELPVGPGLPLYAEGQPQPVVALRGEAGAIVEVLTD